MSVAAGSAFAGSGAAWRKESAVIFFEVDDQIGIRRPGLPEMRFFFVAGAGRIVFPSRDAASQQGTQPVMSVCPFAEIFRPVAEDALAGIEAAEPIRSAFARHLEHRLAEVLSPALYLRFVAHRMSARVFHGSSEGCHASFLGSVADEGLDSALGGLPLATEAIEILTRHTRRFLEDFARHRAEDRAAIVALLGGSAELAVGALEVGLSDPHRSGRSVVRVTFADGRQLYYKPRSLAADSVWSAGLQRVNQWLPLSLRAPAVADREDHGWAEAIPEHRLVTRREADAFYWRCGALLGVAWLLDAVDLHRDNVLISHEHPVVVDLESLLHPLHPREERSLARTGLLPEAGPGLDASCLGETEAQEGPALAAWRGVGTDDLRLVSRPMRIGEALHLPLCEGALAAPRGAGAFITDGFATAARAAAGDREAIDDWRQRLSAAPRRRIYRSTEAYAGLLEGLTGSHYLKTQDLRATAIADWQKTEPLEEAVLRGERAQLSVWDLPVFSAPCGSAGEAPFPQFAERLQELKRLFPRSASAVSVQLRASFRVD